MGAKKIVGIRFLYLKTSRMICSINTAIFIHHFL